MTLSLDTNAAVDLLRGRHPEIREHFATARRLGTAIVISTIVLAELAYGVRASARPDPQMKRLDDLLGDVPVVDFDPSDAMMAGSLFGQLATSGRPIGVGDVLIAGQAINRGWTVVTHDITHFGRVQGLSLVDWRRSAERLTISEITARVTRAPEDT